jgi:uncharacterized protein YggE
VKLFRLALLVAGVAAVVVFAGVGLPEQASTATPASRAITVTGTGTVTAVPNQSTFTFGVAARGATAVDALATDSARMQKLIAALKGAGIGSESLQTSSVSLSARTDDSGDVVVGYDASNSVTVTVKSIDRAGPIVDAAVAAGANQVDGPNLTVSDQSALYKKALAGAVADARAKAQALAAASGLHVGAVTSVAEQTGASSPLPYDTARASLSSGTPVAAGSQQITASVTVTFDAASA